MQAAYGMRTPWRSEEGVTMIEYAILAALIAVAMVVSIILIKNALTDSFTSVAEGFKS